MAAAPSSVPFFGSDADAEVIALSPKTLMATNRFICEVCNKGFQREQNLQLHRRGHNLPWKLKQKTNKEPKRKVFLCPEPTCVHHDPSRALGDLTGIKKHYSRKHGEKKWKCEKCSKRYAVQSDWKAHSKTCGTREYRCECGTLFSRRDSLITHRAFCDALAQETARHPASLNTIGGHQIYGNSHVNLSLSQIGSQFSSLQNHPSSSILRLGSTTVTTPKLEHLINPSSNPSSFGNPPQNNFPTSAFFNIPESPNQNFQHHHQSDHHHHNQPFFSNKPLHVLTQLPDLQPNNNNSSSSDLFNLGFFSNVDGNGTGTNHGTTIFSTSHVGGDHIVGSGMSSSLLYSDINNSVRQENLSPQMSATALLQKAAQIESTSSLVDASSLLRSLRDSATRAAVKSERDQLNIASSSSFGTGDPTMGNESHLQGFMNSLANNGSSSNAFGGFNGDGISLEQRQDNRNLSDLDETNKLHQNLGMHFGESDKLTLDFLGVGEIVRNMQGGGIGGMGSLDPQLKSTQQSQLFGGTTLQ
ncbi:Zinc finger protein MAGPIE [Morus notabilis]|uniref:Zinc finger protein MAGPIE n=1 Tax=Morus notabilis TaxID=981085 RepID=W9R3X0_9ROSA|nr:Zinc finger protein MAGPIE [Morus notabilis]